jgi:hypothetical protein
MIQRELMRILAQIVFALHTYTVQYKFKMHTFSFFLQTLRKSKLLTKTSQDQYKKVFLTY